MNYPTVGNTSQQGFTLVEVLVSLVAMAIGFIIVFGLHYSSIKLESSDNRRTAALEVVRSVIERCRAQDCPNGSDCFALFPDLANDPSFAKLPPGTDCNVTQQLSGSGNWRRDLNATISWPDRFKGLGGRGTATNVNQRVRLSTIYIDH